jgi:hypothetical protein
MCTKPNAEVEALHPKAMPVILTTPEEVDDHAFGVVIDNRSHAPVSVGSLGFKNQAACDGS